MRGGIFIEMKAVITTFFKDLPKAQDCVKFRKKAWKTRFRILADKKGFYVVSESALKACGLLPRRNIGITLK